MSIRVSRVLHAGYVFECGKTKIAFDPIFENPFSGNSFAYPNVKFDLNKIKDLKFDAVFISHFHDDHCSLESLNLLQKDIPIYLFCIHEELFQLIRAVGFKTVHSLKLNHTIHVGDFKVTTKRALDEDVDSLFHIQAADINILNVVDSWIDYEMLDELSKITWDLVLWPFQTMRELEVLSPSRFPPASLRLPPEWLEQMKRLNPKAIVPSSCQFIQEPWSWYRWAYFPITYKNFETEVLTILPSTKVIRLDPSKSISIDSRYIQSASPLSWIYPTDKHSIDYEYDAYGTPPSTAIIAKNFRALTDEQNIRITYFCETEILSLYQQPSDIYFESRKIWQLSVIDHMGMTKNYYYYLEKNKINVCSEVIEQADWLTEVPIAKLYGALELGESITTMYLRINDRVFKSSIESEISQIDVLNDPLIICLSSRGVAEYQKYQLKKIKDS
jgi:hypothetical protein